MSNQYEKYKINTIKFSEHCYENAGLHDAALCSPSLNGRVNEAATLTKESSNIDTEKLLKKIIAFGILTEKNIIYQINAFTVMSLRSVTAKTS